MSGHLRWIIGVAAGVATILSKNSQVHTAH
jgi:hypothetical protein